MLTRRQFLTRAGMLSLGAGGSALALTAANGDLPDTLPDGSAARGMITPAAEQAIERGLAYLSAKWRANRSFGTNQYAGNVAVTSLAGLAFMAGGSQPGRGPYGQLVTDALKAVLATEDPGLPGYLHSRDRQHGPMYGHGFGTLFLAEACGMVPDPKLRDKVRETLKRAVKVIIKAQNAEGGWRYTPTSRDADISVTICQIMALRAARNAGITVPKEPTVSKCIDYVKRCQDWRAGWFRYQAQGSGGPHQAFARTAAGVCALYSAGIYKDKAVELGLKYLMKHKPSGGFPPRPDMHYFYGHYYAAQAMWTAGGDYWAQWFPAIRDELLARQQAQGDWEDMICRHYGTAMACIILQIPNNYLPILQK